MQTVYIAGPITNVNGYEYEFKRKEQELKKLGYKVFNPVPIGQKYKRLQGDREIKHEEYMKVCLPYLLQSDYITLLNGWEKSEGATFEKETAKVCGIPILKARAIDG